MDIDMLSSKSGLNNKQLRFVMEYLTDSNGKQAAIRAGYSPKTAEVQASRLLSNVKVKAAVAEGQKFLQEKTETEAEWVRRRLKEEADDRSEFSTHAGRIRALEILGRINGIFEKDNRQKTDPLRDLLAGLSGNVFGVVRSEAIEE